ncbi:MAG: hypothetical protein K940chlam2_00319 [Chlamydiae bacterium]|nr:hypothetical protein [Chlamydiota bacterium]
MKIAIFLLLCSSIFAREKKVLICGVCRNVEQAAANTIANIEALGNRFADYAVIIYENNSTDGTARCYQEWAQTNPHVIFISEMVPDIQLSPSRTERIARARNRVLSVARGEEYSEFDYLIMVDLDFLCPWPIEEILKTIELPLEWDCIAANGLIGDQYSDHYALRDRTFPLGPEMVGSFWWKESWADYRLEGDELLPVYSAFGGLAIYKMSSMLPFSYSGTVTEDLSLFYREILSSMAEEHPHAKRYRIEIGKGYTCELSELPIRFQRNTKAESPKLYRDPTCCEHLPLHASMAVHGFGKIYINPKLLLHY